jgi:hypothetical protein
LSEGPFSAKLSPIKSIMVTVNSWLADLHEGLVLFGNGQGGPAGIDPGLAVFHGSIAATTFLTLAVLRRCGLRLFVT